MPVAADYSELTTNTAASAKVGAIWRYAASTSGNHLVLPDGCIDLMVKFRPDETDAVRERQLIVTGPSDRPEFVPLVAGDHFVGIRFRAGWGGHCLHVIARDLRNSQWQNLEVERKLGAVVQPLRDAQSRQDLSEAIVAVAGALERGATKLPAGVIQAIQVLHLAGGRISSAELATLTGMAERTLRRLAGDAIGLPLKTLSAVLQFQRTVRLLSARQPLGLSAAALEGGYGDQSHMTRAFRRFGGFTPGRRPRLVLVTLPLADLAEIYKK